MSNCNYTSIIYEQECIGDSLVKINNNFNNLDNATCDLNANLSTLSAGITAFITNTISSSSTNWNNTYNTVSLLSSTWDQTTSVNTILTSYVPLSGNSTIQGDLNVQNHILSGSTNLLDIFTTLNKVISYLSTSNVLISSLTLPATATPPAVSGTPVAWMNIVVNSSSYKLPLYQ